MAVSFARELEQTLHNAIANASARHHVYATLEHLLLALIEDPHASRVMEACAVSIRELSDKVVHYIDHELDELRADRFFADEVEIEEEEEGELKGGVASGGPLTQDAESEEAVGPSESQTPDKPTRKAYEASGPSPTSGFQRVIQRSILHVQSSGRDEVTGANVLVALFSERDSYAVYFLQQQDMSRLDAVTYISHGVGKGELIGELEGQKDDRPETAIPTSPTLRRIFRDDLKAVFDSVTTEPVLNTPRIADKIVEFSLDLVAQAAMSRRTPGLGRRSLLTVGIYGPWGSGKSTLLRRIGERLAEEHLVTVFINTWKWSGGEDIYTFMNREILRSLSQVKAMRFRVLLVRLMLRIRARSRQWIAWLVFLTIVAVAGVTVDWTSAITTLDVAKGSALAVISGLLLAIVAKPLGSAVEKAILQDTQDFDSEQALSQSYRYLELLRRMTYEAKSGPIVFLFDDLDRCDDAKVVEFIKSIHSLTSDGSICILACDEQFAAAAIYSQFKKVADYLDEGKAFGTRFLEKIIQLPFRLPEVSRDDLVALGLMPAPDIRSQHPDAVERDTGRTEDTAHSTPSHVVKDLEPAGAEEVVSEARLSEICGDTLTLVVEPCRIQIRQAKMLSNVVKLYSMIFPPMDEASAQRLAAFLIISYLDEHWIPRKYFSHRAAEEEAADLDHLETELRRRLGDDVAALERLYRLFGVRRPRACALPRGRESPALA
jgi:KAP family P-loop domain/Clp amino terminal domain, pathogenicity island component